MLKLKVPFISHNPIVSIRPFICVNKTQLSELSLRKSYLHTVKQIFILLIVIHGSGPCGSAS